MMLFERHLIESDLPVRSALERLNELAADGILFIVNENQELVGSVTDGDLRRGFIRGLGFDNPITDFAMRASKFVLEDKIDFLELLQLRSDGYRMIPILNNERKIVDVINFNLQKSHLPLDVVIMAGGEGRRLLPLTQDTPKPLLVLGDKPIIEHSIDRLAQYGVRNITITIKYLGHQIKEYFGDGSRKNIAINYYEESDPMGTIGSVAMISDFKNDYVMVTYSDLLTDIDYEEMYQFLLQNNGDMVVATTSYEVQIPYGVIETDGDRIVSLKEKPTYLYYANAGIYIIKKELLELIPKGKKYDATDLMEALYQGGKMVLNFPIRGYWLDIGKHNDFEKAQKDIKYLKL